MTYKTNTDLASQLDQIINIEQPINTPDQAGGFNTNWQIIHTTYAKIQQINTQFHLTEKYQTQKIQTTNLYKIIIRTYPTLTTQMRITTNTQSHNILQIIPYQQNNNYLKLITKTP